MNIKKFPVNGSGALSKLNNESISEFNLSANSGEKEKIMIVMIIDIIKKMKKVIVVVFMIRPFL
jgi:hypothetical protein